MTTFDLREDLAVSAGRNVNVVLMLIGDKDHTTALDMRTLCDKMDEGIEAKAEDSRRFVRARMISNAGHVPFVDQFRAFVSEVDHFLKWSTPIPRNGRAEILLD